jgi:GLPGLI family protein
MKVLLFALLFFTHLICFAQHDNISINYRCSFNKNFERGSNIIDFRGSLLISHSGSFFYMLPSNPLDISGSNLEISAATDTFLLTSKDIKKEMLVFAEPSLDGTVKYFRDTLHPIQWQLIDESKMIDSLECFKATAFFKGREYTAWYCPAIPIANGPWKLGGLPGLIVEAYENNKDLHFMLTQLTYDKHQSLEAERVFPSPLPDYPAYKKYWMDLIRKLDGAIAATESNTSCVGCQTKPSTKVYMWEKWIE